MYLHMNRPNTDFSTSSLSPSLRLELNGKNMLALFDLTNTISNDEVMMRDIWKDLCEEIKYEGTNTTCADRVNFADIWDVWFGVESHHIHASLVKQGLIPEDHPYHDHQTMHAAFRDKYNEAVRVGKLTARPHIMPILSMLKNAGVDVVIVTNNPPDLTDMVFKALNITDEEGNFKEWHSIRHMVYPHGNLRAKPENDMPLEAIRWAKENLLSRYDHIIAVEDSPVGLKAMNAASAALSKQGDTSFDTIITYSSDIFEGVHPLANYRIDSITGGKDFRDIVAAVGFGRKKPLAHDVDLAIPDPRKIDISPYVFNDAKDKVAKAFVDKGTMDDFPIELSGVIGQGHRVASGQAEENPFGDSTIRLQMNAFRERGLDLEELIDDFYLGTINIQIDNHWLYGVRPDVTVANVHWGYPHRKRPEDFYFFQCRIEYAAEGEEPKMYKGHIYYPSPMTKEDEPDNAGKPNTPVHDFSRLEFLGGHIPGIEYGRPIKIHLKPNAFLITPVVEPKKEAHAQTANKIPSGSGQGRPAPRLS